MTLKNKLVEIVGIQIRKKALLNSNECIKVKQHYTEINISTIILLQRHGHFGLISFLSKSILQVYLYPILHIS